LGKKIVTEEAGRPRGGVVPRDLRGETGRSGEKGGTERFVRETSSTHRKKKGLLPGMR